ncbi:MAG: Hsp20/alpha crystallin family protein [Deltaproteobacteria bacterium]|nr:Hsp20/alpha crystallin family protein [Deltaproteobacteria bacterium]
MGIIPGRKKTDVAVRKEQLEPTLGQFRHEMNSLFDNFFRDPWSIFGTGAETRGLGAWIPSLDMSEDEKQVKVTMEVPGIDPEHIDISVTGNTLTVSGEKREEKEDKGKDFYHTERHYGSFKRTVELPDNADMESIKADYKNGVLTLSADKTGDVTKKRIAISKR